MKVRMDVTTRYLVCLMVVTAFGALTAQAALTASNTPPRSSTITPRRAGGSSTGALTEEQIASLKTEWTDPKSGKVFQFSASFAAGKVDPKDQRKYAKSGKVPFRITATLAEIKEVNDDGYFPYQAIEREES